MSDWIHTLPVGCMAVLIFGGTYLGAAAIYSLVMTLAVEERARAFKGISPGLLPPLGIIFGLLVAFLAAQVWGNVDRANAAVNREASALRTVVLLSALENALDARRQRILVSRSEVNWVKWMAVMIQAICTLTAIAMVHSDNRVTAGIAMGLFSTAVAVCILLIAAHDRPFTGQLSVGPAVLLQVQPESLPAATGP